MKAVLAVLAALCLAGPPVGAETPAGRSVNQVAVDLLREGLGPGNAACSPYSVASALALTWAAARGSTAADLARSLHLAGEDVLVTYSALHRALADLPEVRWAEANRLWSDLAFLPAFLEEVKGALGAEPTQVSFQDAPAALAAINGWVKTATLGQIPQLLQRGDLRSATTLVLTNAVYFQGRWEQPFDPRRTTAGTFHRGETGDVQVPFMRQSGLFACFEGKREEVLELPYRGNRLVLDVVLPRGPLPAYEQGLTATGLAELLASLPAGPDDLGNFPRPVEVELPRFRLDSRTDLTEVVRRVGGDGPFAPQSDLSRGLGPAGVGLRLGRVLHAARLETDEQGTTAAAATAVLVLRSGPARFVADRPFLVLVRDLQTGAILFLGRVVDPT